MKTENERYALAVKATQDGLWDWDLVHNRVFYSSQWKIMLGFEENYPFGDSPEVWFERVHPDDIKSLELKIKTHLQGLSAYFEDEYRMYTEKGYYIWVLSRGQAIRDDQGKGVRFLGLHMDITDRKRKEQQYLYDSFHDNLTNLPNRALFMDRLSQALLSRFPFAVLYMDLDKFKDVNDRLGHQAGDELLSMIATRIAECSRAGDTTARLGGDEFALLLPNISSLQEVTPIAQRILHEVSKPFSVEGYKVISPLSIGIALGNSLNYKTPLEIVRDADIALYQAKEKGGYVIFDEKMKKESTFHFQLEADFKKAMRKNEITVFYQPIVNLQTNQIAGLEAVLRWSHKKYGLLTPRDFLRWVEEKNLILPLEKDVFKLAFAQFARLQREIDEGQTLFLALNISDQFLRDESLETHCNEILTQNSLSSSSVYLEIKERLVMTNREKIGSILKKIKGLGFKLTLDDFGIGYSSLISLHHYGFDALKIDRTLVSQMENDKMSREFVRLIIQVATALNLKVIAEGVETEQCLSLLREFTVEYAQGFFYSKPLPMEDIISLFFQKNEEKKGL